VPGQVIMHLLITGKPGVGKTTLIKKIYQTIITRSNIEAIGFYTAEVREGANRTGFKVINLNNEQDQGCLAKIGGSGPKVGRYTVDIDSFERIAIPILETAINYRPSSSKQLIILIDEIGKMELLSRKFRQLINQLYVAWRHTADDHGVKIVSTVPISRGIGAVEDIRSEKGIKEFTVTPYNRNEMVDQIVDMLIGNTLTR